MANRPWFGGTRILILTTDIARLVFGYCSRKCYLFVTASCHVQEG